MRELVSRFLNNGISRRDFIRNLAALGLTASAVATVLETLDRMEYPTGKNLTAPETILKGTGGELFVAQARAAGVEYLFTNPGSFEVGVFDAVVDDKQIHLIEGLHEGIVLSMADGYHKVSGKPGFVNVHAIAGTAQIAGQLYNSCRDGSALVITAGLNDNQLWSDEVLLGARPGFDQKEINRQFTKISWESREAANLPLMLRRAFKVATTPPGGPVYLATAHYALEQRNISATIYPAERFLLPVRVHPDSTAVEKAAGALMEAKNPVVIVGDEVWKSGAQEELLHFVEYLGVPVVKPGGTILGCAYQPFPTAHPLFLGNWYGYYDGLGQATDLVFFIGAPDVGGKTIPKSPELPVKSRILRLGMNLSDNGRNYPTDIVLLADVKAGLQDLSAALNARLTKSAAESISGGRSERLKHISAEARQKIDREISDKIGKSPIHPYELGKVMFGKMQ